MRKITFLLSFILMYGVSSAQEQHVFPAAYSNINQHVVGDHAVPAEGIPNFDPTIPIARAESSILFRPEEGDLLFDNGPVFNVEEPELLSVLQASLNMNTFGANITSPTFALADDFTLDNPADITTMNFYTYQTGATPPTIISAYIQVYDDDPSFGAAPIWGDLTTDRYFDSEATGGYRVSENSMGDRTREIEMVTVETPGLSLEAGTYWVEMSLVGTASSGPWGPPIVIDGETTTGDAVQRTADGWQAWVDSGTGTAQGVPFQVYGTETLSVNNFERTGLSFYPNPVTDVLNITAALNIESVKVFNMLGQQLVKAQLTEGQLDVSSFAAGTYVVQVEFEGGITETFKILK